MIKTNFVFIYLNHHVSLQLAYMKTCWNILFNLLYFWYRDVSVKAKSPSLKMFVHHREMISGQARKNPSQRQQKSTRLKTGTKVDCVSFNKTNHLYKIPYIRVFHGSTHLQKLEKIFNLSCVIFSRLKYSSKSKLQMYIGKYFFVLCGLLCVLQSENDGQNSENWTMNQYENNRIYGITY